VEGLRRVPGERLWREVRKILRPHESIHSRPQAFHSFPTSWTRGANFAGSATSAGFRRFHSAYYDYD